MVKLTFAEYSKVKENISQMSQRELSYYLNDIYKSGYRDGYEACCSSDEDDDENGVDLTFVSIVIKATRGVGDVLHKRIMDNIVKLAFGKGNEDGRT